MRPLTITTAARGGAAGGVRSAPGGPGWHLGPHLPLIACPSLGPMRLGSRPRTPTRGPEARAAGRQPSSTEWGQPLNGATHGGAPGAGGRPAEGVSP